MRDIIRRNYAVLFFDVDGTLLDFDASEEEGLRTVLAEYAHSRELDGMIGAYRAINRRLWDSYENGLIAKEQITETRFGALLTAYGIAADGAKLERKYRDFLSGSAIAFDEARQVLEYLSGRYELYVVTNGFFETQTRRMAEAGLEPYFKKSFISEAVGYQKPQRGFFDACFAEIGEEKREKSLVIGDSLTSDIKGGEAAGIGTCWYNPKGLPNELGVRVDFEVRSLIELMELL